MDSLFDDLPVTQPRQRTDVALLHRMGCKLCPLSKITSNLNPDMAPTGSDKPVVYIMAEAPGKTEDEEGEQLVGESGQILRARVPRAFKDKVRFNNTVRTRPPKNRTPTPVEVECCRPSVENDIARTKPKAIFGLGDVPLRWVSGFSGITMWRGRRMPVNIRGHSCWYYPMLHPAYLIYQRRRSAKDGGIGSEEERMFRFDMKRAFEDVEAGLPEPVVHEVEDVFRNIESITTFGKEGLRRIKAALEWAKKQPDIGVDYETDRLRPYAKGARILTAAVDNGVKGYAIPFEHPEVEWTEDELEELFVMWEDFLEHAVGRKWVHNLAFELEWTGVRFKKRRLVRAGNWQDTASQACILDERRGKHKPGPFSLEFLVQQRFGFNLKSLSPVDRKNLAKVPLDIVLRYNGGDARYHCLLGLEQERDIAGQGLMPAYELQLRRVPTVVLTQMKGVPVDQDENARLAKKYKKRYKEVEKKIFALPVIRKFEAIKRDLFKPFSNPDVLYVFKELLKRSEIKVENKWSDEVKYSADKKILDTIDHPLAKLLVELRESNKRKSTYIDPLNALFDESVVYDDGLLHAVFNTIFAETGRLSCEGPNLQNFPKRDGEAKEVRRQIICPPGHLMLALDYGQIEARVIAMFTKDPVFCKSLWERYDVHMEWAERLSRAYPARVGGKQNFTDKKVMKDFRTDIKNQWTFPLFFGAQLESAAGYLKIPVDKLRPEYERFWEIFATTKDWQDDLMKFYEKNGYVECLTGRRRRGPLSLNQVINSPVQGTAAEIVLDGMSRLSEKNDPELQPEINIHDDLTFCRVPVKKVDDIAEKIIGEMIKVPFPWVNVPISVELSVGENWMPFDKITNPRGLQEFDTFFSDTWAK